MKRRRKRKLFGKRNHYRQPIARKLSTGLENLERRALLTGLVGWGEVIDGDPGIEKEEVAFEKISQTGDQGHFQKQASVNLKKLKMQKDQQERQATFKQADLDFADFEMPNGRDYQQRQGISGDYYFTPHSVYEGAWNFRFKNHPNSHHHQTSNGTGRTNINTFIYDDYVVTVWVNPDGTIGEIMIKDDDKRAADDTTDDEANTDDGETNSNSNNNPGTGTGSPSGGGGTYSGTSSDENIVNELETPPEEGDEDLEPDDPPIAEGGGDDEGEDSGETDDDNDDGESEEDDDGEEDDGGNSGGENESNDVVLLPTPLDEIIIEDDTGDGDDDDSGGGGGEDEGDGETIECPDPPPGGSAPTHPDC